MLLCAEIKHEDLKRVRRKDTNTIVQPKHPNQLNSFHMVIKCTTCGQECSRRNKWPNNELSEGDNPSQQDNTSSPTLTLSQQGNTQSSAKILVNNFIFVSYFFLILKVKFYTLFKFLIILSNRLLQLGCE